MPTCTQCGAEVMPGARFCRQCGAPVSTKQVCPGCGAELQPGSAFCSECGTRISSAPAQQPVQAPATPVAPATGAAPVPTGTTVQQKSGIPLGQNITAVPSTGPATAPYNPPVQQPQNTVQPEPQQVTVNPGQPAGVKTYGGLKALYIILLVPSIFFMLALLYFIFSFFVYDHYYDYFLEDWWYRDYLFGMVDRWTLSGYQGEILGFIFIALFCTAFFLTPALVVKGVRKKMIRRQQQAA